MLTTWGEKFTKEECDIILREAPVDSRNRIDLRRFANLVTKGAEDEQETEEAWLTDFSDQSRHNFINSPWLCSAQIAQPKSRRAR